MKKKILFAAAVLIAFGFGYSFHGCSEKYGIHVASAPWMPEGASDGAFYTGGTAGIIGPPYFHGEFTISEADFQGYMEQRGKELTEVDKPLYVRRYLERFIRTEDFRKGRAIDYDAHDEACGTTVKNGLYWQHGKDDQSYLYLFDRDQGRAYLELTFR